MDQQERKLDAEVEAATGEPVLAEADATPAAEAPAAKPLTVRHTDGDFMFGSAGKKSEIEPDLHPLNSILTDKRRRPKSGRRRCVAAYLTR